MTKDEALGHKKIRPSEVTYAEGGKFIGAVFLYMFLALAITAVVSTIFGLVFSKFVFNSSTSSSSGDNTFTIVMIISLVLYIPVMIWAEIAAAKNHKSMNIAYVIYAVVMGIMISSFTALIPFYTIAIAFGATCLAFGLMTLIAWFSRSSLNTIAIIGMGLLFGGALVGAINAILFACNVNVTMSMWIVSYVILIAVILITIVDIRRVKEISDNGGAGTNIALMCALSLYVDFIYIFIRILALVARFKR